MSLCDQSYCYQISFTMDCHVFLHNDGTNILVELDFALNLKFTFESSFTSLWCKIYISLGFFRHFDLFLMKKDERDVCSD